MAEYISREAAITAVKTHCPAKYETAVLVRLVCIPAADVVEVVRCRDCRMSEPCADERECYCTLTHAYKPTEYFCADGEMDEDN